MDRVSISHEWNEAPDYKSFASSMLDLLLEFEAKGILDNFVAEAQANMPDEIKAIVEACSGFHADENDVQDRLDALSIVEPTEGDAENIAADIEAIESGIETTGDGVEVFEDDPLGESGEAA